MFKKDLKRGLQGRTYFLVENTIDCFMFQFYIKNKKNNCNFPVPEALISLYWNGGWPTATEVVTEKQNKSITSKHLLHQSGPPGIIYSIFNMFYILHFCLAFMLLYLKTVLHEVFCQKNS